MRRSGAGADLPAVKFPLDKMEKCPYTEKRKLPRKEARKMTMTVYFVIREKELCKGILRACGRE